MSNNQARIAVIQAQRNLKSTQVNRLLYYRDVEKLAPSWSLSEDPGHALSNITSMGVERHSVGRSQVSASFARSPSQKLCEVIRMPTVPSPYLHGAEVHAFNTTPCRPLPIPAAPMHVTALACRWFAHSVVQTSCPVGMNDPASSSPPGLNSSCCPLSSPA